MVLSILRTLAHRFGGIALATICTGAFGADHEGNVLVRRVVPANFADKEFDRTKFQSLLTTSINRALDVKPRATVSGILREQFNISQGWTPAIYEQLETHVLRLNGISDPTRDLKAGDTLKVPDLPRTAQVFLGGDKPLFSSTKSSVAARWNPQIAAITATPSISTNAPGTASTELQIREFPISALKEMRLPAATMNRTELIERNEYQILQERMEVTLAAESAAVASGPLLSQTESTALRTFLNRPARTRPLVVILDDGYPSQDDFRQTAQFVIRASREIREKFGLQDATHRDSPNLIRLENSYKTGTLFCDEDCEYPKLKMHSAMIRESLKELSDLDTSQRVEIIYLPINLAQVFTKEIYAEVLNVTLLAESVTDGLVLMAPGIQPPPNSQRNRPAYDTIDPQIEKILKPTFLYEPIRAFTGGVMTMKTDRALVDAVVNFMWLYSMASQRPHFISMSWTSPNLRYPVLFRPNGYGLWLAAAGNDPKINIHTDLRQFAARSSDPGDVLAVANVKTACASSSFTVDTNVPIYGFMFPGRVSPSICGTSFSTPRVAWFLAAFEAIKGDPVIPYTASWNSWRAAKRNKLMNMQGAGLSGEDRYRVSPWKILEESAP